MLRSSSTWRSSALVAGLLLALPGARAQARLCLPPLFDAGARLHSVGSVEIQWLPLLLRQHEVCWDARPGRRRVFALGNSAVYGHPLAPEETAWGLLNRDFDSDGVAVHVFNLGFSFTYQLKEAMILHEALAFEPDLLVVGLSLPDFLHQAPLAYPPLLHFFDTNRDTVAALARERHPGLAEPFERWRAYYAAGAFPPVAFTSLRQSGLYLRQSLRRAARALRAHWLGGKARRSAPVAARREDYDCERTRREFAESFADWSDWSLLPWLQEIAHERRIPVLLVNLPVAHEPKDGCYNTRFPADALAHYDAWLAQEAQRRGLRLVDLHDLLPPEAFLDSIHPGAAGQRAIAEALAPEILRALAR